MIGMSRILSQVIVRKLPVTVHYVLSDKNLGEYNIEQEFPATLLLKPLDEWRQPIWLPNPRALDSHLVVTIQDQHYYRIGMYEYINTSAAQRALVWRLKIKLEDLQDV
jgi:hypothetical protein